MKRISLIIMCLCTFQLLSTAQTTGIFNKVIADTVFSRDYRFRQLPAFSTYNALTNITAGDQNLATPPGTTAQRPTVPAGKIILRYNTDSSALEFGNSSQVWKTLGMSSVQTFDTSSIPNFYLKVRSLFSATAPLQYNSVIGQLLIPQATSGQAGYLASADWVTFNAKLPDPGSNGLLARTSLGTVAARQFVPGSNNISLVNANGVSGNPSIDLNDTLSLAQVMLSAVPTVATTADSILFLNRSTNLLEVRPFTAGVGTVTSVSGTSNRISVTNPATTPIVDISASYIGQASITTLGTIGTGAWNATPIGTAKGGAPSGGNTGQVLTKNSNTSYDYGWATPSTGSISGLAAIGSTGSPNANGATISGSNLILQPTNGAFGGVVNTDTQTIAGSKRFTAAHNTIQKHSVRLNSQWMPTEKIADPINTGRYDGFGFADFLPSGKYFMIYSNAVNHIGDSAVIRIRRSADQGRTWNDTATVVASGTTGEFVNMGGGGVTNSGRIIVFYFQYAMPGNITTSLNIIYSDNEGVTWSSPTSISMGLEDTDVLPYGPLVKIGGDSLLLSWYGKHGTTSGVYILKSGDDGQTWGSNINVFNDVAEIRNESSFCYLGGSTVLGLLRGESGNTYKQTISYDNGTTWTHIGNVAFGQSGTPPWTRTFTGLDGRKMAVCYYKQGSEIKAIYASAADLMTAGTAAWKVESEMVLATGISGNLYTNICHPYDQPYGLGYYYTEIVALTTTEIKFLTVPKPYSIPGIHVFKGQVGIGAIPDPGVDLHIEKTNDAYAYMLGGASFDEAFVWGKRPLGSGDFAQIKRTGSTNNFAMTNHGHTLTLSTNTSGSTRPDIHILSNGNVGIRNSAPEVLFDIKGGQSKAGSSESLAMFGSNDASNRLALFINAENNATAGNRAMAFVCLEGGTARPIWLNAGGGEVMIGTTSNGGEKFQVVGSVALDLGSDATGDMYTRGAGGAVQRVAAGTAGHVLTSNGPGTVPTYQSPGAITTLYSGDGTLAANRVVSGAGFNLSLGWSGSQLGTLFMYSNKISVASRMDFVTDDVNSDANYTTLAGRSVIEVRSNLTTDRTFTMPSASLGQGDRLTVIMRYSTNVNHYQLSAAIEDNKTGTTFTQLEWGTTYVFHVSTAANWILIDKY